MGRVYTTDREWSNANAAWTEIAIRMPAEGGVLWGITVHIASATAINVLSGRVILVYNFTAAEPSDNAGTVTFPGGSGLGGGPMSQILVPWKSFRILEGLVFHGPRKIAPSSRTFLFVDIRNDTGAAVGTRCSIDMEVPS